MEIERERCAWWLAVGVLGAVVGGGARELDPGACAARFDLQRDKIIRTEESREMGARYISELDVGARQECLRLCCETEGCDVFVYEERGPGSCYMFECGPPEDFRCKFTAHTNFSSGVLALSRRLAELQDQEALAHHERDLANLRDRSATTAATSTTSSTTPPAPPPPPRAPPVSPTEPGGGGGGGCSRYQFECRRGGECIAVYNACDGVPQCEDGSDEAPELGCPPAVAAPSPPPPPPPAADRWPHRLTQAQPVQQQHRYHNEQLSAPSSHIFSHKGGLLQETEPPQPPPQYPPFEPPAAPPPAPWPRRVWTQTQNGMENVGGWGAYGRVPGAGAGGRLEWGEAGAGARRAWPVPQARLEDSVPEVMPPVLHYSTSQQHTLRDSAKKGLEVAPPPPPAAARDPTPPPPDRREEEPPPSTRAEPTARVGTRNDKPVGPARASGGDGGMERHLGDEHEDGLSERPPAAVLLLVIGVCMTACMAAMVCCRGRAARRRLRRGKPFAHDADYLVNGMYL